MDGETTVRYVAGFMFDSGAQRVLLIEKNRPTWMAGKYNAIGGKIEDGETAYQAMAREFKEEADIETKPGDWFHFCTLKGMPPSGKGFCVEFFWCASNKLGDAKQMTDEALHVWNVPALFSGTRRIVPNLQWLVPMAMSKMFPSTDIAHSYEVQEIYTDLPMDG